MILLKLIIFASVMLSCHLFGQNFDPETGEYYSKNFKYLSLKIGLGSGSIKQFNAESAFSNPTIPSQKLWTASVIDLSTKNNLPQLSMLVGGWKGVLGGEIEFSWDNQFIPEQIVYYDCHGDIFIPPTDDYPEGYYYTISPQDSVDLPENFLKFNTFSFGGTAFLNLDLSDNIKPYAGIGLLVGISNVNSDFPGPGSYAAKNIMAAFGYKLSDSQSLNTTDLMWGFKAPIGIKYLANEKLFFNFGASFSRQFLSFVGSDAYLREEDTATLQNIQIILGTGFFL